MRKCAFSGHQPQSQAFCFIELDEDGIRLKEALKKLIVQLIEEEGVSYFITDMEAGTDMISAEIVLELKSQFPKIELECVIPFETQAAEWPEPLRDRYFSIASRCDKETMLQTHYTTDCMQRLNSYMVDHADVILAVWDGGLSWTASAVANAQKLGKLVRIINPKTYSVA